MFCWNTHQAHFMHTKQEHLKYWLKNIITTIDSTYLKYFEMEFVHLHVTQCINKISENIIFTWKKKNQQHNVTSMTKQIKNEEKKNWKIKYEYTTLYNCILLNYINVALFECSIFSSFSNFKWMCNSICGNRHLNPNHNQTNENTNKK